MSTIGQRIKTVRQEIGLNQDDFAAIGGVQRRAQANYEADQRVPDANYLSALAQYGIDIAYILGGVRLNMETPGTAIHNMKVKGNIPGQAITSHQLGSSISMNVDNNKVALESLNTELLHKIALMLEKVAKQAGKQWSMPQLIDTAALVYNFLIREETVNDEKIERTLKLVVNR